MADEPVLPQHRSDPFTRLRALLRELYNGHSPAAVRFRLWVLWVDFAIIAFFMVAPILRDVPGFLVIDYFIAFILALELIGRGLGYSSFRRWIRRPIVWVDLFVLLTLLAPHLGYNLGYLRMLRLWALLHSDFFWETVGKRFDDTRWEDVAKTVATMVTFLFVVSGLVYSGYHDRAQGLHSYVDALYFVVTSVSTTGYGDITLPGQIGKLISIAIMISGVTLFVRLGQTLLRPHKVRFQCPRCGLMRHDQDAVHCKACGLLLNIPDEGAGH